MFIFLYRKDREMGSSIHWFTLQIPTTARAKPGCSQEPRAPSRFPMWAARAQALEQSSAWPRRSHSQEAGSEAESLEHKASIPTWDVGFPSGSWTIWTTTCNSDDEKMICVSACPWPSPSQLTSGALNQTAYWKSASMLPRSSGWLQGSFPTGTQFQIAAL